MASPSNGQPQQGWKTPRLLWKHPSPESTYMYKFKCTIEEKRGIDLPTFHELYNYSVTRRADFWADAWEDFRLIHEGIYTRVVDESVRIDSVPKWFEGVRLNFAENLLYTRSPSTSDPGGHSTLHKEDDKIACVEIREGRSSEKSYTWRQLRERARRFAAAMKAHGVRKGDRVAIVASNSMDTLCVFLGATMLGGIFSSSSADMGVKGILDRLEQIRPRWLFMDDWAVYNGKTIDLRPKMKEVVERVSTMGEFAGCVSMARFEKEPADVSGMPRTTRLDAFLEEGKEYHGKVEFERVGFGDPFLIVYSSGTTGQPKCLVHSVGGVLMSAVKEGKLHREQRPDSTVLQYTTTGWIMYLVSTNCLLFGAKMIMYDGSPFLPKLDTFIKLVGDHKVTHLGISPRYLHEIQKNHIVPREITDLSALHFVTSTGMVLSDDLFEWFYDVAFPARTQLANISGGTDIAGSFGTDNPLLPVYVGGCQGLSLGTAVEVFDQLIEGGKGVPGRPVPEGVPGELVATKAFPNMPVKFWGDEGGKKYFGAYFERFDNVWTHGDFVMIHPITKGLIFLGRADGVLNPSGIRFGSAEIYGIIDAHFSDKVAESICVGQRRPQDVDESVMLFLLMKPGKEFTKELVKDIKDAIQRGLSRRHVPKYVFETHDIPTTVNLKKVELPVKRIVSGENIKPSETLLNPQSLDYYYQFAKVEELVEPASKL